MSACQTFFTRGIWGEGALGGGGTFDLENFPTSGVKGWILLDAINGHLLLQLRSSTLESHKATTRTALLNRKASWP